MGDDYRGGGPLLDSARYTQSSWKKWMRPKDMDINRGWHCGPPISPDHTKDHMTSIGTCNGNVPWDSSQSDLKQPLRRSARGSSWSPYPCGGYARGYAPGVVPAPPTSEVIPWTQPRVIELTQEDWAKTLQLQVWCRTVFTLHSKLIYLWPLLVYFISQTGFTLELAQIWVCYEGCLWMLSLIFHNM